MKQNSSLLQVRFWGVRGSYPVAQKAMLGVGGNTTSVEIVSPYTRLILDAGTGIIQLGQSLANKPDKTLVLGLTHWHHDHLQGLPFFAPLYCARELQILAPAASAHQATTHLRRLMRAPNFPIRWEDTPALKVIHPLHAPEDADGGAAGPAPFEFNDLAIYTLASTTHPGGVTVYRIEWNGLKIVFATDVESEPGSTMPLIAFAQDADILIHDAQYTRKHYFGLPPYTSATRGWGHSTYEMATAVAQAANVKQLVLFHHDPSYDDDTIARNLAQTRVHFPNTLCATEGMTLRLHAPPTHVAVMPDLELVAQQRETAG